MAMAVEGVQGNARSSCQPEDYITTKALRGHEQIPPNGAVIIAGMEKPKGPVNLPFGVVDNLEHFAP